MDTNTWLLIALIAVMGFCCLPMLFRGRHRKHSEHQEQHRPEEPKKGATNTNKAKPKSDHEATNESKGTTKERKSSAATLG